MQDPTVDRKPALDRITVDLQQQLIVRVICRPGLHGQPKSEHLMSVRIGAITHVLIPGGAGHMAIQIAAACRMVSLTDLCASRRASAVANCASDPWRPQRLQSFRTLRR
jgi:hypothetical protein